MSEGPDTAANANAITAAVIVAAGRGLRAGGTVAKQWQQVAGARVIDHTLAAFRSHPRIGPVVLVLHADALSDAPPDVMVATGGDTRSASVAAGLAVLETTAPDLVLIHDVARPCIPAAVIDRVIDALSASAGAAPALAVTDALWTGSEGRVTGIRAREGLFRAQTPQGFRYAEILKAHRAHSGEASDDVAVARAAGLDVVIVEGCETNLKITHPGDFDRAAQILRARERDN